MSVNDVYSPNFQSTSVSDQLSDKWLGTNKVSQVDMNNQLELQKASAMNKYEWNKQGMLAAGINPIMNTGALSGADASPVQTSNHGTPMDRVVDKLLNIVTLGVKSAKESGGK